MNQASVFDECAATYDEALDRGLSLSGEPKEFFARRRVEWLAARLREHGYRPRVALDYGCGTGGTTQMLLETFRAASATGVDVSVESIRRARTACANSRVRFDTIEEWNPAGGYDVAYCNGVFHHIEPDDRPAALAAIGRALSPGGYFAFWENNPWNPGTRLVMRRIPFDRDAKTLSAPRARRLLEAAGFDVVTTDFLFLFPRAFALLRPIESALTCIPAGAQYMVLCRKRRS